MKDEYLKMAYNATKGEIEEIISVAFEPDSPWINVQLKDQLLSIPSFLYTELVDYVKDGAFSQAKRITGTKADLIADRDELRRQLEVIYEGCGKVFAAVSHVLREELRAEYKRILENDDDIKQKISRLESLVEKSRDLVGFFGVKGDTKGYTTGGLIYGSDVDDCLASIRGHESLITIFEGRMHTQSYYTPDQTRVSLEKLRQLRDMALPKAKDYIALQIAVSEYNKPKSDGRSSNKQDKRIMPESAFWNRVSELNWQNERGTPEYWVPDELKIFSGYKVSDEQKKNPVALTESTIRRRLIAFRDGDIEIIDGEGVFVKKNAAD